MSGAKIGWSATAGSLDKKELITEFQSALSDEIAAVKKQNVGRKTEIFDGQRIHSSKVLNIKRYLERQKATNEHSKSSLNGSQIERLQRG